MDQTKNCIKRNTGLIATTFVWEQLKTSEIKELNTKKHFISWQKSNVDTNDEKWLC